MTRFSDTPLAATLLRVALAVDRREQGAATCLTERATEDGSTDPAGHAESDAMSGCPSTKSANERGGVDARAGRGTEP